MLAGVTVGILFDFYRALRKWMGWGKIATSIGDIAFSVVVLFVFFRFFLKANALDFRFYIIWGSLLGLFLYLRLLSEVILRIYFRAFRLIRSMLHIIMVGLKIPVNILNLLMRPPYAVLRWFSLLVYRILESCLGQKLHKFHHKILSFWTNLFPPRTNG